MKDFLPVIRSAQLFSGVSEDELTAMLSCLKAEKKDFPKEAFVLRSGDTADSIGLALAGNRSGHTRRTFGATAISSPRRGRARPSLPPMPALPARC